MADYLNPQDLANAKLDAKTLGEALNDEKVVKPRYGKSYDSFPLLVRKLLDGGGFRPFPNEQAIKDYVPTVTPSVAKDMSTYKLWLWDKGVWADTGLSELERAKEDAAKKYLPRFIQDNPEYLFALIAAQNLMTDLTIDKSGQFADFVIERWRERINTENGISIASNPNYMLAFLDKNNLMTDLTLDNSGQLADFVVERLSKRINVDPRPYKNPTEFIFNGGVKPARPDLKKFALWGSSSLSGMTQFFRSFAESVGVTDFHAGAKGGERVEQISARMGSNPALLKFPSGEIPASGEVEVTVNWIANRLMMTYEGVVEGVHGTFRVDYDSKLHYFKRTTSGSSITVNPEMSYPLIPDAKSYKNAVCIINVGKNNFTASTDNSAEFVLKRTAEMVEYLSPLFKYVIVMGHFVNTTELTPPNVTAAKRVTDCNAGLEAAYGDLYYDMNSYVLSSRIWTDTGIAPTPTDLHQQSIGQKPDSLSADIQHLNSKASKAVVDQVINKIKNLNWY